MKGNLNHSNLERLRKYGYCHDIEPEDKDYEVVKFKCIDESELLKKTDYTTGMYSKFNRIVHMDNSSA